MPEFVTPKSINRKEPIEIQSIRELIRRIPDELPKEISYLSQQLASMEAGHNGECKIDRKLETIPLPNLHHIIPNFSTRSKLGSFYQMDTIILTNRYILLLEIKNIRGEIEFQTNPNQLKRTFEGKIDYLTCPLTQTERNFTALKRIVHHAHPKIPVYTAIVFAHASSRITSFQKNFSILYRKQLDIHIEKLNTLSEVLDKKDFQHLVRIMKHADKNHLPESLTNRYNINTQILKKGIFCSACGSSTSFQHIHYQCTTCGEIDDSALKRSVESLFVILGPQLKVKTLKYYLNLSAKDRIIRILRKMNVERTGTTNSSIYTMKSK